MTTSRIVGDLAKIWPITSVAACLPAFIMCCLLMIDSVERYLADRAKLWLLLLDMSLVCFIWLALGHVLWAF